MQFEIAGFDWDKGNSEKCRKHGLGIEEIEAAFRSGPFIAPDPRHSDPMFIAFTYRESNGRTFVRPVSARYMHKKEAQRYETYSKAQD